MDSLIIPESKNTPAIRFNAQTGRLDIEGNSLPEDVMGFYTKVIDWINAYIENPCTKTELHIKLNYFNSASAKVILDILRILEALTDRNVEITVFWYYVDIDEDMLETGKEYETMVKIPFQYISYIPN